MRSSPKPIDWQAVTLCEIAHQGNSGLVDGPFGSNLRASEYTETGVPVIRGSNLSLGTERFVESEFVYVSEATATRLARSICRPLDILFTKKGTLGQTGIVPQRPEYRECLLSSNQMKLTVNSGLADPYYVYYYVSSPSSQRKIRQDSESTGVPKINLEYLRGFPIRLPPLPEQRAIAHILGTLDDKIELNRQMNQTLEAIARAIFKSWFVDFDPVCAKAEGRAPAGMDAETAALFPDRFVESELGMIPAGWEAERVESLVHVKPDRLTPMTFPNETFDYYSFPAYDEGKQPVLGLGSEIKSSKFFVPDGCVLLSRLNPRFSKVWMPNPGGRRRSICSTEFFVTLPSAAASREYLYGLFTSDLFFRRFEMLVTGTSSSHQRIKQNSFRAMNSVMPPIEVIQRFSDLMSPIHEKVSRNISENDTLSKLRDTLLPKLISGELRVPAEMHTQILPLRR